MPETREVVRTRAVPANFPHEKVQQIEQHLEREFPHAPRGWGFHVSKSRTAGETILTAVVTVSPSDYGDDFIRDVESIIDTWIDEALSD